jgi:hypothetical protein
VRTSTAEHSDATAVTLLVGSNDVLGSVSTTWCKQFGNKLNCLVDPPSLEGYVCALRGIARELEAMPTHPPVAVVSIPMIGEVLTNPVNREVLVTFLFSS